MASYDAYVFADYKITCFSWDYPGFLILKHTQIVKRKKWSISEVVCSSQYMTSLLSLQHAITLRFIKQQLLPLNPAPVTELGNSNNINLNLMKL